MDIDRLKDDIVFSASIAGREFTFHSTWGLFSPKAIDEGSQLLLKHLDANPDDISIDIGCGWGPLGLALAHLSPDGKVHMVDKDFTAIEYAKKNTELNGFTNCEIYLSNAFSEVPDMKFNNIVSNIPANIGKEMLSIILADAYQHLAPGGKIVVVTISGLKDYIKRNFKEVFGNYTKVKQGKSYTVATAYRE